MKPPHGLSAAEAALWRKVTASVKPLRPVEPPLKGEVASRSGAGGMSPPKVIPLRQPSGLPPPPQGEDRGKTVPLAPSGGLDASWDRRLRTGTLSPDLTLDLHGYTLDQAHRRLDLGLGQAKAMGARLVLLITGKQRTAEAADRGERRGAIRAKVLDWLAAGPHGSDIAAVRTAHRRHGGEGALYLVLRRRR